MNSTRIRVSRTDLSPTELFHNPPPVTSSPEGDYRSSGAVPIASPDTEEFASERRYPKGDPLAPVTPLKAQNTRARPNK